MFFFPVLSKLDKETTRYFKVIVFISISNFLAMFWDIFGLNVETSSLYFLFKAFFIFLIPIIVFLYPSDRKGPLCVTLSVLYYFYCYYSVVNIDFSYYTAFVQFFFGCVYFLRFSKHEFTISHIVGLILYLLTILQLKSNLPFEEFQTKVQLMNGAVLPVYFISILIFYYIRRKEIADNAKSAFFEKIGVDVGFILHEIKRPLSMIQGSNQEKSLEEISELIEIANIMWPGPEKKFDIPEVNIDIRVLIEEVLLQYSDYLEYLNIKIDYNLDFTHFNLNRGFLKIIVKNIIKNALEYYKEFDGERVIYISSLTEDELIFENNVNKKINTDLIFKVGQTTKKNLTNRGLGLYICSELCSKIKAKISAKSNSKRFQIILKFE